MSLIDFFAKTKIPEQKDESGIEMEMHDVEKKVDNVSKVLNARWNKLEKEILDDEILIKVTEEAFEQLEKIFDYGKKKGNNRIVGMYKSREVGVWKNEKQRLKKEKEWLKKLLHLKLKGDEKEWHQFKDIFGIHAFVVPDGTKIAVFRSSLLYRFLEQTGIGNNLKLLKRLVNVYDKKSDGTYNLTKQYNLSKEPNMRKAIELFLGILEENLDVLKENKEKIRRDGSYTYSLINLITHELTHLLWAVNFDMSRGTFIYRQGINESWSNIKQVLGYLHNENITEKLLNEEINKLYALIGVKSNISAYTKKSGGFSKHLFMSAFTFLFGALFLIDVILRKEGKPGRKFLGRKFLSLAFKSPDIHQIYLWTLKSLEELDNKRLKNIIHKRLINEFLTVNKEITQEVIKEIVRCFESIKNTKSKWQDLQTKLKEFLGLIDVLSLLGYGKNKIKKLKKEMEKLIKKHLKNYIKASEEVAKIVKNEKGYIKKLEKLFSDVDHHLRFLESSITTQK
jgi:hypothetical protein|tara:strand:+ start:10986 stop:12512 length:1527 start_codon:yes stop_codon:yes gene_type:complete